MERRRTADLRALRDLNFVAESDPPVTGEMDRQRAGRRAGCGIFRDAVRRREHPRLPALARPGEAIDARMREARERAEVGRECDDLLLAAELEKDVFRAEVIELDGKT